jgi:thiol-disulfide isomerase/thioredoxin
MRCRLLVVAAVLGGVLAAGAAEDPKPNPKVTATEVRADELTKAIADQKGKVVLVDCWATWCAPCVKKFPHLVEMHKKYADKGLAVVSLSFDDPALPKQVDDAKTFLIEKKSVMTNLLLDEEQGVGFDKLNIGAIPAVFIYGPDGKEVKRFTMEDPNNQFTYEDVEKAVETLLDGKALPKDEPAKPEEKSTKNP